MCICTEVFFVLLGFFPEMSGLLKMRFGPFFARTRFFCFIQSPGS